MASGMDIWGAIASAIGVLSTVQIVLTLINGRLPSKRIRLFERTLKDTEELLDSVSEEGLFNDNGRYVTHTKTRISNICKRLEDLREESFEAKTYGQELKQWWSGLSGRIAVCNDELKELRAEISVTSSKARTTLAQQLQDVPRDGTGSVVLGGESDEVSTVEIVLGVDPCDAVSVEPDCTTTLGQPNHKPGEDEQENGLGATAASTVGSGDDSDTKFVHCCLRDTPQSGVRPPSADTLPPYRQRSILSTCPPCVTSSYLCASTSTSQPPMVRTTSLPSRCTTADSARATRKLIKAYRRKLMAHNVSWKPQGAQHTHHGTSAAAFARAADRPSNITRHWKLLEEKSRAPLRSYIAVLSHEEIIDTSRDATGTSHACSTIISRDGLPTASNC